MKALAGANPDAKPDYRTQALTELNKLESKVILLNEMLDNVDTERGERFAQGDAYDVRPNSFCVHYGKLTCLLLSHSKSHLFSRAPGPRSKGGSRMQRQTIRSH